MAPKRPHRIDVSVIGPTSDSHAGFDGTQSHVNVEIMVQAEEHGEHVYWTLNAHVYNDRDGYRSGMYLRLGMNPYTDYLTAPHARAIAAALERLARYQRTLPIQPTTLADHVAVVLAYHKAERVDYVGFADHHSRATTHNADVATAWAVRAIAYAEMALLAERSLRPEQDAVA